MMMRRVAPILALVLSLAACGSAGYGQKADYPSSAGTPDDLAEVDDLAARQEALAKELDQALVTPVAADRCEDLCLHHAQICELADKICSVAAKYPHSAKATGSCETAREVCADTRSRLPSECGCS